MVLRWLISRASNPKGVNLYSQTTIRAGGGFEGVEEWLMGVGLQQPTVIGGAKNSNPDRPTQRADELHGTSAGDQDLCSICESLGRSARHPP